MCGRYYNFISKDEMSHYKNYEIIEKYKNYNITPESNIVAIFNNELFKVKWGFFPSWLKEMKNSKPLINARAESILEKKTFKTPFLKRRCLIPMSGWYEWSLNNNNKIPYAFYNNSHNPLYIGAIFNNRSDGTTEICIITKSANNDLQSIHERMPLVVDKELFSDWFNYENDPEILKENIINQKVSDIKFHKVDVAVNNPKNNNSELYKEYKEITF